MNSGKSPGVARAEFRAAMGSFAASVTIVGTLDAEGRPHGLTATAFTSVSLDPPLCLVCIDNAARALAPLLATRRFALSFLAADQEPSSRHFARDVDDKFAGHAWQPAPLTGCPSIEGALASVECEVHAVHEGGDHTIVVGRVLATTTADALPLVYFRGSYADLVPRR